MVGVPYTMWVGYLKLLWANFDVKPKEVLEVCCGTGKLCRLLALDDYEATGVDISESMVEEGNKIAKKNGLYIRLYCQDAAEMKLGRKFDAAFSFFDSLNYLADPLRCARAIARTAEHLKPGGLFAFDVNTPYAFEQRMFDQEDMRPQIKVRYSWKGDWDADAKICNVKMKFWVGTTAFEEVHTQRAHSIDELTGWMSDAGFVSIRCYDAFTLDPPRGRSDRIHIVGSTKPTAD